MAARRRRRSASDGEQITTAKKLDGDEIATRLKLDNWIVYFAEGVATPFVGAVPVAMTVGRRDLDI
ncbi:hypothetical protein TIFTF001_010034 [Ficus carica]|uniref:Uncharacterized protein n=1 Tax=Ficus carica TaxID=3494 RepID=A0AA88D1S2_FICCA|nr:hypothetical protein TIFTF001_010034 [Ficus carica]